MPFVSVFGLFTMAAAIRICVTLAAFRLISFPIQRYDAYAYVLKALEILRGDWSPIYTHAIGLPMALAPILRLVGGSSIFEHMTTAIIATAFMGAAITFPLAWLGRRLLFSRTATYVLLVVFATSFSMILPEVHIIVMTEPLFTLAFLITLCFIYKSSDNPWWIHAAAVTGGLAYWIRPNGIFILPILLLSYYALNRKTAHFNKWHLGLSCLIFFAVASPFLLERAAYFGSAFDYGENNEYFTDTYANAWGPAPRLTLTDYLSTHGLGEIAMKFGVRGAGIVMLYFFYSILPISFFFFFGAGPRLKEKAWMPIWISLTIWLIGLTPVFSIYYLVRHLFPVIPLSIIVAVAGCEDLCARYEKGIATSRIRSFFLATNIIFLATALSILFFIYLAMKKDESRIMHDGLIWSSWIRTHVRGTLAMGNGLDVAMMLFPDTTVGGEGIMNLRAPQSGLRVMYPGKFTEIVDAMPVFKKYAVTHVALDDRVSAKRSWILDKHLSIYDGKFFPPYLEEIYSNYGTNSQWKVRIFKINWKEYKR